MNERVCVLIGQGPLRESDFSLIYRLLKRVFN